MLMFFYKITNRENGDIFNVFDSITLKLEKTVKTNKRLLFRKHWFLSFYLHKNNDVR